MKHNTDTLYTTLTGGTFAGAAYLFGGVDNLLIALAIFIICDFLTGLAVGGQNKKVNSEKAIKGLLKKGAMISLVIVANQLDLITSGDSHFMRNSMIFFLIATEGISLVENLNKLGVTVPNFFKQRFEQIKSDNDKRAD